MVTFRINVTILLTQCYPNLKEPMRKSVFILMCFSLLVSGSWAQDARVIWQKNIGGSGDDMVNSMVSDNEGNTYVLSSVQNGNNHDLEIAKLNKTGTFLWVTTIAGERDETGNDLLLNKNGELVVLGATYSEKLLGNTTKGYADLLVATLSPNGEILMTNTYGGSRNDFPASIVEKSNGNYVITGTSWSTDGDLTENKGQADVWLFETQSNGTILWGKTLGGLDDESAVETILLPNDELLTLGNSSTYEGDYAANHGDQDIVLYRMDAEGNVIWQNLYGGFYAESAASVHLKENGNFFVAGTTFSDDGNITSNAGNSDAWLFEVATTGSLIWSRTYGSYDNESVVAMAQTETGFLILGSSSSSVINDLTNHGSADFWLYEIDDTKKITREYLFGASGFESSSSMLLQSDGSVLMGGASSSSDGVVQENSGKNDGWLLKIDQQSSSDDAQVLVHPNPTKDVIYLNNIPDYAEISLYGIDGNCIREPQSTNRSVEIMDLANVPSGVYLLKIQHGETLETHRIVKQ